jgi:hypothetical protein
MCRGSELDRFRAMVANLPKHATIIVIGSDKNLPNLAPMLKERKYFVFARIPINMGEMIETDILAKIKMPTISDEGAYFIPSDHEFSLAEICFKGEVREISSHAMIISSPYPVGNFGLAHMRCQGLSDLLGRNPYVKITNVTKAEGGEQTGYLIECHFCDVEARETKSAPQTIDPLQVSAIRHETVPQVIQSSQERKRPQSKLASYLLSLILLTIFIFFVVNYLQTPLTFLARWVPDLLHK